MSLTKDQIIKMIDLDEPDYQSIIMNLDQSDIPVLVDLIKDPNPAIAAKAVSCLGFMDSPAAVTGLGVAAKHKNPILRVVAANSLKNLSDNPAAVKLIDKLLDDTDIGVRKFAMKTVETKNIKSLKAKIEAISKNEKNDQLKAFSKEILKKL
jgi:HEAT repeat protein